MHKKHDQPAKSKNNTSFDNIGCDKTAYDNTANNDKTGYDNETSQIGATPRNAIEAEPANFYMEWIRFHVDRISGPRKPNIMTMIERPEFRTYRA